MSDTVFWSWQNDLPSKTNREFVREALLEAVKRVSEKLDLEEVQRLELDHDTKSTPGMADIGRTILEKISKCAVLVADVTPICKNEDGKYLPNPNVMIELGYGLNAIGFERIIAILNTSYGASIEDLPFDIRHRRILTYQLAESADKISRRAVREDLIKQLAAAIQTNVTEVRDAKSSAEPIVGAESHPNSPGLWKANWPAKLEGFFGDVAEVQPEFRSRAWLRIIPSTYAKGVPPMSRLQTLPEEARLWAPSGGGSNGNYGACEFGYLAYWTSRSDEEDIEMAPNLVGFLEQTGEVWFSDGTVFDERRGKTILSYGKLLSTWAKGMAQGMACLDALGASPRRRVIMGIHGMNDTVWPEQTGYVSSRSRKQELLFDQTERAWPEIKRISFLFSAWNRLRDAFSQSQMSEEEFSKYYAARKRS